jgi:hypothetical protein
MTSGVRMIWPSHRSIGLALGLIALDLSLANPLTSPLAAQANPKPAVMPTVAPIGGNSSPAPASPPLVKPTTKSPKASPEASPTPLAKPAPKPSKLVVCNEDWACFQKQAPSCTASQYRETKDYNLLEPTTGILYKARTLYEIWKVPGDRCAVYSSANVTQIQFSDRYKKTLRASGLNAGQISALERRTTSEALQMPGNISFCRVGQGRDVGPFLEIISQRREGQLVGQPGQYQMVNGKMQLTKPGRYSVALAGRTIADCDPPR